ncbi:hypothetical protein FJ987_04660 [Mesorhizobium sp. CU2]|uniref:hypothetical protein n=1 Tax=unclassified Mesorhizobium TaxID=325217 RepID=UPI001126AB23|nr:MULTISPECIES: hypothetical protein [unclassified Mesorhizobium]TPN86633.1 hypothetical protein FJ988_07625 [Mesorhizobium sp. CU3]TPO20433.1 hypothetical protein FJ987_04660 [Mesorhizobium sp. CU2]
MHIKAEGPFPPAELAREELLRFLSTGFPGSVLGESNEMLAYLETTVSNDKPSAPVASRGRLWLRLPCLFSTWKPFPA